MIILVEGNPVDGFRFIAPDGGFKDITEAEIYATEHLKYDDWWAADVEPPIDFEDNVADDEEETKVADDEVVPEPARFKAGIGPVVE